MFELQISNLETSGYIRKVWATKAIGLVDPEIKVEPTENYWVEKFHDIARDDPGQFKPLKDQVINCLYFSRRFGPDDKVLIHCHAGVSRSTAIAISVLLYHGLTPKEAYNEIQKIRGQMWPNPLIIQYTDELLRLDGQLIQYDREWKQKNRVY